MSMLQMSPDEEDEEFWGRLKSIPSDLHNANDKPKETGRCQAPDLPTEAAAPEETSQHEQTCSSPRPIATITTQWPSENDGATALFEGRQEENNNDGGGDVDGQSAVPREKILQRISSKKKAKSYQ